MGKNYQEELEQIPSTAKWAAELDLSQWQSQLARLRKRSLVVVASGGSYSAAQLLAQCHTATTGQLATVMTPLEFSTENRPLQASVWFISASGGNVDILNAWDAAAARGVLDMAILCGATESKLAAAAKNWHGAISVTFDLASGRDGFLATNSLLAFYIVILRLYGFDVSAGPEPLPATVPPGEEALFKPTLVVLYGGWLKAIALDIESRFTEAALGAVQIADYRNFAHGRHHWIAKLGPDTAVLALVAPQFTDLARDTLNLLPPETVVRTWKVGSDSPSEVVPTLLKSLVLSKAAAARRGFDAGRPGVPPFGEQIYNLRTKAGAPPAEASASLAVKRKAFVCGASSPAKLAELSDELRQFQDSLRQTIFSGVVLDYDGTVVATPFRFKPIDPAMSGTLNRLLDQGLGLAFATGRGKSIHTELRKAIATEHWCKVLIGYYNGGLIRKLDASCEDLANQPQNLELQKAQMELCAELKLDAEQCELRPTQITVKRPGVIGIDLWLAVRGSLDRTGLTSLKVKLSSHSVDVLPREVSKCRVIRTLAEMRGTPESSILKIGDRGHWPGNDAEMLAMSHGLSVDEVSGDAGSCWNLVPHGIVGPAATIWYLDRLQHGRLSIP